MTTKKHLSPPLPALQTAGAAEHFRRLAQLLTEEGETAAAVLREKLRHRSPAEAERAGLALVGLKMEMQTGGLAGRTILTLKKRASSPLPWTNLGTGSPVLLRPQTEEKEPGWRAIVTGLTQTTIQVAMEFDPEDLDDDTLYRLDSSPDEVTLARQKAALETISKASLESRIPREKRLAELRDILLGLAPPHFDAPEAISADGNSLNSGQREAIAHAFSARDVAVIHGPPGTGKTTTVAHLIRLAVNRGEKILVTAASNLAVDNVLERLIPAGVRAIRIGHPARVLPELRAHTLDYLVLDHDDYHLASKYRKDAFKLFHQAGKFTRAKPAPGAKETMRREARALLREAKKLENQAMRRILENADVICITATAIDARILGDLFFDRIIMDEAGQATEPTTWLPITWGKRLVLAGDHLQLPPTITSPAALQGGLGVSLMERVVGHFDKETTRTLTEQYRMNREIMVFPSAEFYGRQLVAHPSVAGHRLEDLEHVTPHHTTRMPLVFMDTAGANFEDEQETDGESRFNKGEARLIVKLVEEHLALGLAPRDIGIISPYAAQVRLLRQLTQSRYDGLETESIDGFQGREKELILISLVRSNLAGEIGFLHEWRRLNVAFTRARRKMLVVGDSATLGHHPFFTRWLEYVGALNGHESIWEREDLAP